MLAGVAWRLALVALAAAVVLLGLPAWVRAPLSIAAALVTVDSVVVRIRGRGPIHALLVAVGGGIVVLALLGLVLNLLPWGLTAGSWGVGAGLIEAGALVALAFWPAPAARAAGAGRPMLGGTVLVRPVLTWTVLVCAVLAGAVAWSVASFTATHVAPLAVAAEPSGASVVERVTSGTTQGPFELDLVTTARRRVLQRDVRVGPDAASTTVVRLPADTRGLVQLVRPGSAQPVRELILDTTPAAKGDR